MSKITEDQKKLFLELYKKGFRGRYISGQVGMSKKYAESIIYSLDSGDYSWFDSSFCHHEKSITENEKARIVEEMSESEMSWSEAVSKYGFPENTLQMWKRNYNKYGVCSRKRGRTRKEGSDGYERDSKDQATRKREEIIARREHYLKDVLPGLCGKRDGSSKKKILRTVGECRGLGIHLNRCLEVLGLSSSTYHFWKNHENDENQKDKKLSEAIKCIQEQNRWAYGSKRMAKFLVREGFADRINHKRVERVMSRFNLHAKIRRRRYPKNYYLALKNNPVELPGNVLARDFIADEPMQKLVTDITYLPTDEGWIYMAAVMDLWNREIVSYRIRRHISLNLVKDVISGLERYRGALIHSDMGWTYTHPSYIGHLKELGLRQSMSRKGNCWDNACMENFFGLMKSETIRQTKQLLTVDEMIKLIDDYIYWYNNQRIQKKLGYLSPVNFRKLAT